MTFDNTTKQFARMIKRVSEMVTTFTRIAKHLLHVIFRQKKLVAHDVCTSMRRDYNNKKSNNS